MLHSLVACYQQKHLIAEMRLFWKPCWVDQELVAIQLPSCYVILCFCTWVHLLESTSTITEDIP
jgi:hypothetical protein